MSKGGAGGGSSFYSIFCGVRLAKGGFACFFETCGTVGK